MLMQRGRFDEERLPVGRFVTIGMKKRRGGAGRMGRVAAVFSFTSCTPLRLSFAFEMLYINKSEREN